MHIWNTVQNKLYISKKIAKLTSFFPIQIHGTLTLTDLKLI